MFLISGCCMFSPLKEFPVAWRPALRVHERSAGDDVEEGDGRGDKRHPGQYRPGHASNRSRELKCMSRAKKRGLHPRQYIGPV